MLASTDATTFTSATEVRDTLVALVLRTAAAFEPDGAALAAPDIDVASGAKGELARLSARLTEARPRLLGAGLTSPILADASAYPFAAPEQLARWLDDDTARVLLDAVVAPEGRESCPDLGEHHQALLALGIRRLEAPSVRIDPTGIWIAARDVLGEPAAMRSKWLQRSAGLAKSIVDRLGPALAAARTEADVLRALSRCSARGSLRPAGALVLEASTDRRRSGSHYTPPSVCRAVIERTLAPLVEGADAETILSLRVCDPAMGSGAFLVEAARFLAERLIASRTARRDPESHRAALREVVTRCVYGVDKDAVAVDLARWTLARLGAKNDRPLDLSRRLRAGDALVGPGFLPPKQAAPFHLDGSSFDWGAAFPEIGDAGGFDACVGNPPWVAYAGRAAQPLDVELHRYYEHTNPAFFGYRTLHGLFVRRTAELLRPGGRLGLVVPTSISDLEGYGPTRRAHDELAEVDHDLLDFGNGAFPGVFQPCMGLTSTRRRATAGSQRGAPWPLARTDLDVAARRLLDRLEHLPRLPPELFGERGFQTTGDDLAHLRRSAAPEPPFVVPIREGVDIGEFARRPPRVFLDPRGLRGRLRLPPEWQAVGILIRQTARFPIAALADGVAFRNSILAGFASDEWTAAALAAYLNSSAIRWHHFVRHRDARQGMPQLKVGHLRAIPAIVDAGARTRLDAIGRRLAGRNAGLLAADRAELDGAVFDALDFDVAARSLVVEWAAANPLPSPRSGK